MQHDTNPSVPFLGGGGQMTHLQGPPPKKLEGWTSTALNSEDRVMETFLSALHPSG